MKNVVITKADGTRELFDSNKLRRSLRRAGAAKAEVESIVGQIEASLSEGMKTDEIYRAAFALLRESTRPVAAKYSLRRALFGLGPTGFPFEDFLARLFEAEGYKTKTRLTLRGKCATHEIDVAGYRADHSFVAEAKFHGHPGIKSDLQVAMYSYARYLDLKSTAVCRDDVCGVVSLYVVTNTKFTKAAIDYARCSGIELIGWNAPKGNSLQNRIERAGMYPITVLASLSSSQKERLLASGVILCRDIVARPEMLEGKGISSSKMGEALEEARKLCAQK
ncbi:ATPase [Candidatus Parcubacteria bacterium]|uniref:ATPase n=1 Tax=Candidatus Kaiserbacteria bacterium CG10_big_fil_rev_8_21_14_0_10_47_16 TaxID=1974608 RepID=A0A2H0UDF0_9BACT|nr:ATPase [Candidatus Parcubacteria bacterium]PIR84439.1 MAG: ATPase [Candidatus Kaiserbacteria bacterium CG10_big_fil_rev_8_21_14_0_10_47_16]